MADLQSRLAAKLREALEFFSDAPRFSLRRDRRRESYQLASEIDALLAEVGPERIAAPCPPSDAALGEVPARFSDRRTFTQLEVEGALCAWEWMLDPLGKAVVTQWFEALGSGGMRMCSQQAGAIAVAVFDHMEEQGYEFTGAYDWEFVPDVLERLDWEALTNDNQYNRGRYQPDVHELFITMVTADLARTTDPDRRLFHQREAA